MKRTDNSAKSFSVMGFLLITLFGVCLFVTSCSSEDVQIPSYYVDLVEADTNLDSLVTVIRKDN